MDRALLAGFPVVVEQAVAWGEMDAFAHVNNVAYFRYFENARLEYFRRIDWLGLMDRTGIGPIVASTSARFRRPLFYPDTIAVGARLVVMDADRLTLEHRIVSERLGAVTTEGEVVVVSFDYRHNKKAALPEELRRRIEELEGKGAGDPRQ
ncbi:MAG TPA: thioesterase family protein [Gemmataceae bacterium]